MVNVIRWLGRAALGVAVAFILFNYAVIAWREGFGAVMHLLSPFNVLNWLATLAALAPGFGLIVLADRLERTNRESGRGSL